MGDPYEGDERDDNDGDAYTDNTPDSPPETDVFDPEE